ncbi:MAG: metallophosphoesterase [Oscillospiraceae bacterium]|nr:metallophosphoesterase [Oscillospiraceae bacterium]
MACGILSERKRGTSKFYIADLHLGHENVIKHDGRPFADTAKMHDALVRNWNNAVGHDDEVYILGDFAWKNAEGLTALDELKGKKFLILGNHDKPTEEMKSRFEWIKDYTVIKDGADEVVLCHYPIAHWYNQFRGTVHCTVTSTTTLTIIPLSGTPIFAGIWVFLLSAIMLAVCLNIWGTRRGRWRK